MGLFGALRWFRVSMRLRSDVAFDVGFFRHSSASCKLSRGKQRNRLPDGPPGYESEGIQARWPHRQFLGRFADWPVGFFVAWCVHWPVAWLICRWIHWPISSLMDYFVDSFAKRIADCSVDWLVDRCFDWFAAPPIRLLIGTLIDRWLVWLIRWLASW